MFIIVIAIAWLSVSFAFVLSLALAANRPMPHASTEACLLDEAA
jgi:ABC-type sugar transport system permease subunit